MSDDEDYNPDDYDEFQDEGNLDASDTLEGNPGDDPLDAGIIPADKWSAGMRFGDTAAEEKQGESLDQLLAEEEPDVLANWTARTRKTRARRTTTRTPATRTSTGCSWTTAPTRGRGGW